MNLYIISQEVNNDYDTFSSALVCAETEEEAKLYHPDSRCKYYPEHKQHWRNEDTKKWVSWNTTWVKDIKDVKVEYLGIADKSVDKGIIISSYHAG